MGDLGGRTERHQLTKAELDRLRLLVKQRRAIDRELRRITGESTTHAALTLAQSLTDPSLQPGGREKKRRKRTGASRAARKAVAKQYDDRDRSTSIQTCSGGLPGLGKRR